MPMQSCKKKTTFSRSVIKRKWLPFKRKSHKAKNIRISEKTNYCIVILNVKKKKKHVFMMEKIGIISVDFCAKTNGVN